MTKRLLCILFALLLCVLTACGSKSGGEETSGGGEGSSAPDTLSPDEINGEWMFDWEHGYEAPDLPVADSVKKLVFRTPEKTTFTSEDGITVTFEFMNEYYAPNSMLQLRITVTNNTEYALTYVGNNKNLYFGEESFLFDTDCVPPTEQYYYPQYPDSSSFEGDGAAYDAENAEDTEEKEMSSDALECGDSVTFERIYWIDSADFEALLASNSNTVEISYTFKNRYPMEFTYQASVTLVMEERSAS